MPNFIETKTLSGYPQWINGNHITRIWIEEAITGNVAFKVYYLDINNSAVFLSSHKTQLDAELAVTALLRSMN